METTREGQLVWLADATGHGVAAALCSMTSFAPQIVKIWRERDAASVSLRTYAVTVTGFALWIVYGVLLGAWPVIISRSTQVVVGLADALMVAHLGKAALAATTPGVIHIFLKPDSIAEIGASAARVRDVSRAVGERSAAGGDAIEKMVAQVQEVLKPIHNWFYVEGRPENNDLTWPTTVTYRREPC